MLKGCVVSTIRVEAFSIIMIRFTPTCFGITTIRSLLEIQSIPLTTFTILTHLGDGTLGLQELVLAGIPGMAGT
jgi:hypothetical protein